jgi:hypothetical protein
MPHRIVSRHRLHDSKQQAAEPPRFILDTSGYLVASIVSELKQAGENIPVEEPPGPSTTAIPGQGDDEIAVTFRRRDLVLDNK